MRRVFFGPVALRDLDRIFEWIARDDEAAARRVRVRIATSIELLTAFATGTKGRVRGTFHKVVPGLPYVVVYALKRQEDGDEIVEILTVRHTSRRPLGSR